MDEKSQAEFQLEKVGGILQGWFGYVGSPKMKRIGILRGTLFLNPKGPS